MKRVAIARRLRRDMTEAERRLWSRLRSRQLHGMRFRRQVPIEGFIADFACIEAKLVVEVDGGQHAETVVADRLRSDAIASAGFLVIRFWNSDVMANIEGVIDRIEGALAARSTANV
jgi:very-short-patch-repair endonuclease